LLVVSALTCSKAQKENYGLLLKPCQHSPPKTFFFFSLSFGFFFRRQLLFPFSSTCAFAPAVTSCFVFFWGGGFFFFTKPRDHILECPLPSGINFSLPSPTTRPPFRQLLSEEPSPSAFLRSGVSKLTCGAAKAHDSMQWLPTGAKPFFVKGPRWSQIARRSTLMKGRRTTPAPFPSKAPGSIASV